MSDNIEFSVADHVATITLNRPEKLNAVTPEMALRLLELAKYCNTSDDVRVVILQGAGDRAFCVGSDIRELEDYANPWEFRKRPDYCDAIRGISKPTIAAVDGYAFGGGLELCLSCDIRLASVTTTFAAAEIKLGWIGGGGVSYFLVQAIGQSNAAYMLYTGEPVEASKALSWGMVSEVTEVGGTVSRAEEIAKVIAGNAPIAAATAKDNIRAAYTMPLEMAVKYERDLQTICMSTRDAKEGQEAFKEKRKPHFTGQ